MSWHDIGAEPRDAEGVMVTVVGYRYGSPSSKPIHSVNNSGKGMNLTISPLAMDK